MTKKEPAAFFTASPGHNPHPPWKAVTSSPYRSGTVGRYVDNHPRTKHHSQPIPFNLHLLNKLHRFPLACSPNKKVSRLCALTDVIHPLFPFAGNQFVTDGRLNMRLIMERFIATYEQVCSPLKERFKEKDGRELFLLYLKPIINGTGNYCIEAQTRDQTRTDVIVDYLGQQYIIELKIWHGERYNAEGEKQLNEYLGYWNLDTGYILSINFNRKKEQGVHMIHVGEKLLYEGTF